MKYLVYYRAVCEIEADDLDEAEELFYNEYDEYGEVQIICIEEEEDSI